MRNRLLTDEALRLSALHRYRILDTAPEPEFDDLVRLAAQICDVPIGLVSFIDETRQWFKAKFGLNTEETPRACALCAYAITPPYELFEVPDAAADARFASNPLVTGDPQIRFYAGAPLVTPDGFALGTLCVIDRVPRRLTSEQRDALLALARQVVSQLELRLALAGRERAEARLQAFLNNSPTISWITDADGRIIFLSRACERVFGVLSSETVGKSLAGLLPPDQAAGFLAHIRRVAETGEAVEDIETARRADGTKGEFLIYKFALPEPDGTVLVGGIVADITERAQMLAFQRSQYDRLAALRAIDIGIIMNMDVQAILGLILDQMISLLGVDAADALVRNRETNSMEYAVRRGFHPGFVRPERTAESEIPLDLAVRSERLISLADLPDGGPAFLKSLADSGETFAGYYAVPLIAKGVVGGVIQLYLRTEAAADQSWLEFLETLAGQAAIAIDNANLFNQLERLNEELVVSYDATIEGWSRALDLRDKETEGHSQRVTAMSLQLAREMGIEGESLVHIRRGALLHDVGKLGIPDGILLKPGPLTDDEWEIMKRHPTYAYEMLYPLAFLQSALDIPYCHHEKWDGTGYPNELAGEQIPLAARIFAVADVHDALSCDRPYRKAWSEEEVRKYIASLAGTHFDPEVVAAYFSLTAQQLAS